MGLYVMILSAYPTRDSLVNFIKGGIHKLKIYVSRRWSLFKFVYLILFKMTLLEAPHILRFISCVDLSDPTTYSLSEYINMQTYLTYLHKVIHPFSLGYLGRRIISIWVIVSTAAKIYFFGWHLLLEKIFFWLIFP